MNYFSQNLTQNRYDERYYKEANKKTSNFYVGGRPVRPASKITFRNVTVF